MSGIFQKKCLFVWGVALLASSCISSRPNQRGELGLEGTIFGAWLEVDQHATDNSADDGEQLAGMFFSCSDPKNSIKSKKSAVLRCFLSFEDGDPWDGKSFAPQVKAVWTDGADQKTTDVKAVAAPQLAPHHFEIFLPKQIVLGLDYLESTSPVYITGIN